MQQSSCSPFRTVFSAARSRRFFFNISQAMKGKWLSCLEGFCKHALFSRYVLMSRAGCGTGNYCAVELGATHARLVFQPGRKLWSVGHTVMAELRRVDFLFAMTGAQGVFGGIASS